MINHADAISFQKLRERIFSLIETALAEFDGGSKSYDGQMAINFPGIHDDLNQITISLHCYVLGNGKYHSWSGHNMQDALTKAWADIEQWEGGNVNHIECIDFKGIPDVQINREI